MPTRWETFPVELSGGLVSNLSRLQQGLKQPGSARILENFEPSVKGGYRRINGFVKFDDDIVPPYGSPVAQGSGQTGTSFVVAGLYETPVVGDTFTVAGVTGAYTVSGVSYSTTNKEATLTITPTLDSSPADKAGVSFVSGQSRIEGVYYSALDTATFALRGGSLWMSGGAGWSLVSVPNLGTPLVNGGSQTGTTLTVDGLTIVPVAGDTFSIDGVELVYTVLSATATSLSIYPALDSSPADNAAITMLGSSHTGGAKARFVQFNFNGTIKTAMVDGANNPAVFTGTTYKLLQGTSDITGASYVEEFKDFLFFAKADLIAYSAPFDEDDFTPANGAGSYRLPSSCTGLITFRDQLINFSETDIRRLLGTSGADFALTSITDSIGCVNGDTVQEVGGDILFLGPDGIRFLGATERIGDFNLSLASRQIQTDFTSFVEDSADYCTTVVREKNQYRIFKYKTSMIKATSTGYIGTQFLDQNAQSINWASTKGIKAYRASSTYVNDAEVVLFSNDDDYVFQMESGSTFDEEPILSLFYTPFMSVNDPTIRKTAYSVDTYVDPEGAMTGTLTLKYDFVRPNKIQPNSVSIDAGGAFATWGTMVWGSSSYGGLPDTVIRNNVTGSFFTVSLQYEFDGGQPFVLDTALLEYSTEDRK